MPAYGYASATPSEIDNLTKRLVTPTRASTASTYSFDPQQCHIEYLRKRDPHAYPGDNDRVLKLTEIERISRPTTASKAAAYNFDVQACHLDYIKQCDPEYPPKSSSLTFTDPELTETVGRLTRMTSASRAATHDFDVQAQHLEYIARNDPKYPPQYKKVNGRGLKKVVSRISRPTTASGAATFDFDHQKVNLDHLNRRDPRIPARTRTVSESDFAGVVERLTRPTKASTAARFDFDAQEEHLKYISAHDPYYPGHKKYKNLKGRRCKSAAFNTVSTDQLGSVIKNLTKPTVASQGGAPLRGKKYQYVPPPKNKTYIEVPGADTKYLGGRMVSQDQLGAIVTRLSSPYDPKNAR